MSDVTVRQTMRFVRTHVVELRYEIHETDGNARSIWDSLVTVEN